MSSDFLPFIEQTAREAGALLLRHFKARVKIEYKGDVDLVTVADRESETLIVGRIRERYPKHDILGEEGTRSETGADYKWYIDPLDGTTNFAHGFPVFCVSIALEHKRQRIAGVLYDPTRDELFAAAKGSGATLNGARISVSKTAKLSEALVATGFPSHKRHKNPNIHFYHQITLRTHGVRRAGSAALDLANVASGRVDGFWEFNLNPWDTAAGVLLVEEAGGRVTDFNGGAFDISSREVCASNAELHPALLAEFRAIFEGRVEGVPDAVEYAAARKAPK
ncbi:MAG: inositol monophosphatase [Candidatus Koribacter versatilis]|uniref:Inositol-1-monophosphatase n=1 Tax=Candidatus Korobacter versatilis TaxID=658062 RepID=A0A932EP74_9BACT|nr:inositol monophosphatase [Candidatus Koribacter versatilis]